jgi:hypothetical protein
VKGRVKITVQMSEDLLQQARGVAHQQQTTLRALLEEGLRQVLRGRRRQAGFRLADGSVSGKGVLPGVTEGDWGTVAAGNSNDRGS